MSENCSSCPLQSVDTHTKKQLQCGGTAFFKRFFKSRLKWYFWRGQSTQVPWGSGVKEMKLTEDMSGVDSCRVDTQRAEEALRLQDKNKWSPSEHCTGKTQALHQTRGKGEAVSGPHGPTHSHKHRQKNQKKITNPVSTCARHTLVHTEGFWLRTYQTQKENVYNWECPLHWVSLHNINAALCYYRTTWAPDVWQLKATSGYNLSSTVKKEKKKKPNFCLERTGEITK